MKLGDSIGRFVLLKKLGTGAMAAVYLGLDPVSERLVSVKILFPELCSDDKAVRRFRREAAILRALETTGVVRLIEDGADGERPFMVLEHLRGQSLAQLLASRGPLPPVAALPLMKQVCRALAVAHAHDIIHRDLKPENLWIEEGTGALKILDFGVARTRDQARLTTTGRFLGTLCYAAPEQVRGDEVDARADLYSVGLVFYQLLTGRHALNGETAGAILEQQRTDAYLPPSSARPGLPQGLDHPILKLLRHDREARTQHIDEFQRDLESFEGQMRFQALTTRTVHDFPELAADYQRVVAAMEAKNLDAALEVAESLARRAPGAADVCFLLGEIQVERGHIYQAIQAYTKATVIDAENAHYHLALGLAYESLDMREPARAAYQAALKLDPHGQLARDQLEVLDARGPEPEPGAAAAGASDGEGSALAGGALAGAPAAETVPAVPSAPRMLVRRRLDIVTRSFFWWGWVHRETGHPERCDQVTRLQLGLFAATVLVLGGGALWSARGGAVAGPLASLLGHAFETGLGFLALYVVGSVYFVEQALRTFEKLELQGRVVRDGSDRRPMAINAGRVHGVGKNTVFNIYREENQGTCRGTLIGRMLVQDIFDEISSGSYMRIAGGPPRAGDYAVALETINAGLLDPESGRGAQVSPGAAAPRRGLPAQAGLSAGV